MTKARHETERVGNGLPMKTSILAVTGTLGVAAIGTLLFVSIRPDRWIASAPRSEVARTQAAAPSASPPAPASSSTTAAAPAAKPTPTRVAREDEPFVIKRILPIDGPIRYGDWHWEDADVPEGPVVITVDLDARVLSVFRNGYEVGTTAVLLGTDDKPTPLGVFPITQKDIDHVSNIYTGAPMPYMQRLTDDGITLHGSDVALGYASHGCVGMPDAFAAKLFKLTKLGDKVYITRGKQVGMGDNLAGG